MTVANILRDKGRDVVTTQAHRTLAETIALLADRKVGAVVVADAERRVLGILSERDVVRALATGGAGALSEPVSRHMTAHVETVDEGATIDSVMTTMTTRRFRHLPVVDHNRLSGIISIGDVVKRHVDALDGERRALQEYIATA